MHVSMCMCVHMSPVSNTSTLLGTGNVLVQLNHLLVQMGLEVCVLWALGVGWWCHLPYTKFVCLLGLCRPHRSVTSFLLHIGQDQDQVCAYVHVHVCDQLCPFYSCYYFLFGVFETFLAVGKSHLLSIKSFFLLLESGKSLGLLTCAMCFTLIL